VGLIEAHLVDGSRVKVQLKDEKIEINTRYGKLLIPTADIRSLEFATRVAEDVQKRIESAVAKLGSDEPTAREAATTALLEIGAPAYPWLVEAAKGKDPEVIRRAEELIARIKEKTPEERLKVRKDDVIHTDDWKITGRLTGPTLRMTTAAFGERPV